MGKRRFGRDGGEERLTTRDVGQQSCQESCRRCPCSCGPGNDIGHSSECLNGEDRSVHNRNRHLESDETSLREMSHEYFVFQAFRRQVGADAG